MSKFNRRTLARFISIAKPFFVGDLKWYAFGLLALLVAFSIGVNRLNEIMSFIERDFMTALSLREKDEFFKHLYRYILAFMVAIPVQVFYRYTEERFALMWRRWFSRKVIDRYFAGRAFYRLGSYEGLDNPDQRIADDIRSFTAQSLSFLLIIINAAFAIYLFTQILWSISPTLTFVAIGYALLGTVTTYLLGKPLIGLNFQQLKREADYRYKLINVRDNAESIAFYGREEKESTRVRQRLKEALNNLVSIINWNRNLNFFTTGYNHLIRILPIVIVAPLYLDGKIEFGVVIQAASAFAVVLGALSIIVYNFSSLSSFAAVIDRLGSFWEALDDLDRQQREHHETITLIDDSDIRFSGVTILTPKRDQMLVRDLSLELGSRSLLITGQSGSGKSSILRVLSGIWSAGQGTIHRPHPEACVFLPQRPYMVIGTLRSQLVYATKVLGVPNRRLTEVLHAVGLEEMLERVGGFNADLDWPSMLSTGEQQRLAVARLLIASPHHAFLDEATTALDGASEARLYSLIRGSVRSFISVGYRSGLEQFHDVVLILDGGGRWRIEEASK